MTMYGRNNLDIAESFNPFSNGAGFSTMAMQNRYIISMEILN